MSLSDNFRAVRRIAYFISPHGFGHAARAAAVMEAMAEIDSRVHFEIYTTVPAWFFREAASVSFNYHHLFTDIGLVQKSAFEVDLDRTLNSLNAFYPLASSKIAEITATVKASDIALIVSEIAPLGIRVAKEAGIPSVLVENFTWDWIYQPYVAFDDRIQRHIDYLQALFKAADYHIQAEPVCNRTIADLCTAPVSRKTKASRDMIRQRLRLTATGKMVLITTGGIPQRYDFLEKMAEWRPISFFLAGADTERQTPENVMPLPHRSEFYHPDLVQASDAVIAKVGYSTLSEIFHARVPFGYIPRSNFRESDRMVEFIEKHMTGIAIEESEFLSGNWFDRLEKLLSFPWGQRRVINGADQIANFINRLLAS